MLMHHVKIIRFTDVGNHEMMGFNTISARSIKELRAMSGLSLTSRPAPRATPGLAVRGGRLVERLGTGWFAWLIETVRVMETRRDLAEMDTRMLRDIGISQGEALREAARAPWDISQPRL